jgi:hypothetical protein
LFSPEDEVLRAAFGELRAIERGMTPAFQCDARAVARDSVAIAMRGFAAAVLALFVILTCNSIVQSARAPMPSSYVDMTSWKAPTDFLLETPQSDLLKTVPQFGERNVIR